MGGREDIPFLAHELQVDEIIVALPSASRSEVREILQICQRTGCELKVLPGLYQMINGEVVSKYYVDRSEKIINEVLYENGNVVNNNSTYKEAKRNTL